MNVEEHGLSYFSDFHVNNFLRYIIKSVKMRTLSIPRNINKKRNEQALT